MLRVVSALITLLLLAAPTALAHANYYKSDPARGARLLEAPDRVSVTLSEPVDPDGSSVEVRDANGERIDRGDVRYEAGATPVLSVGLPADLAPGAYKASWRALSSVDGHVTDGTWGFAVGGFEPPAESKESAEYDASSAAARMLAYTGYALGFGVLAFAFYIDPGGRDNALQRVRARLVGVAGLLIALGMGGLFLFTLEESGLSARSFGGTGVGKEFTIRVALAALTLIVGGVAWWKGLGRAVLVALALLLVGGAIGSSAFAHSANKGWWASAIDLAHLVAVATWLGGLALFLHHILYARRQGTYDDVIRVGRRFSRVALASVTVVALTGLASTFLILGSHPFREPVALFTHPYGGFLAGKVLLFFGMIALAGVNRFVFLGERPGPDDAAPPTVYETLRPQPRNQARPFARAVGLEATLGLAVLVLAGFLTAISPPSTLAAQGPDDSLQRLGYGSDHNVTLRIDPAPRGGGSSNVTLTIIEASTGKPLEEAVRVRVVIARASANETGGETYAAHGGENGKWVVGDVLFVDAGDYEARIEVQTESVYRDTLTIPFEVGSP